MTKYSRETTARIFAELRKCPKSVPVIVNFPPHRRVIQDKH